ncbi:MAG: hypothetical protein QGG36_28735 [Pirellulaceae bacterium]|jgi:hypothetical protein|nr:hypothetical protein [Pirellulaceae bacterium]MDP7019819.1 hypothetical protein [Pirellulaceae bacterium]
MKATTLSLIVVALTATSSFAQTNRYFAPAPLRSPALYQHHASTYEEGVLRGAADAIRASGEYQYNASLSRVYNQEAISRYLDNEVKKTTTYFEKRRINRMARAQENGPKPSQEKLNQFARSRAPKALTDVQYTPELGRVAWPSGLNSPQFEAHRAAIDSLVAKRAPNNTQVDQAIQQVAADMAGVLKSEIRSMSPSEYVAAKKFLTGLKVTVESPAGVSGLATR